MSFHGGRRKINPTGFLFRAAPEDKNKVGLMFPRYGLA
jgi:hypothetical protein